MYRNVGDTTDEIHRRASIAKCYVARANANKKYICSTFIGRQFVGYGEKNEQRIARLSDYKRSLCE